MRTRRLPYLLAAAGLALFTTASAATDVLYGLPLAPGVPEPQERPAVTVCGNTMALYYAPLSTAIDTELLVSWYQQNLDGAQHTHFDMGNGRDTLFTGDGLLAVTIITSGDHKTALAVAFGRFDRALKPGEMASFGSGRPNCGS